jgi:hypothetical protein
MGILRTDKISGLETPTPVTGSVEFDGSGDYLQTPDSEIFSLGTNDYTIEGWFYLTTLSATQRIFGQRAADAGSIQMLLETNASGELRYYFAISDSSKNVGGVVATQINTWHHIAVVRKNLVHTLYVDGVSVATNSTDTGTLNNRSQPFSIGRQGDYTSDAFNGHISNFRICKGTAVYTSDFTVPTHALEVTQDTVLLCCNNPDSVTASDHGRVGAAPPTLTANGDPAVSSINPGLTRDFTSGTEFSGVTVFDTQGYFVPPSGTTEQRGRGRAVFGGGDSTGQSYNTSIEYFQLQTSGMSFDFGDLTLARNQVRAVSSSTRGVFGGGRIAPAAAVTNTMDYVTIAATGNAVDFGDLSVARGATAPASSSTRGVFMAGYDPANTNHIDYITIASLGNATDFGDTLTSTHAAGGCASPTRGVMGGGFPGINTMEYITIASTGNSVDFGDRVQTQHSIAGCSSQTRGIFGGGDTPGADNLIDYITIATTGNAQDFGDLVTQSSGTKSATSDQINGCFFAGWTGSAYVTDVQKVNIASTGNAVNFGSVMFGRHQTGATSDSHGGLS